MEKEEDKYLLFNDTEEDTGKEMKEKEKKTASNEKTTSKGPSDTLIAFNEAYSGNQLLKVLYFVVFLHPAIEYVLNQAVVNSMFTTEDYVRVNKCGLGLLIALLFFIQFLTVDKSTTVILTFITIIFILMHLSKKMNSKEMPLKAKSSFKRLFKPK